MCNQANLSMLWKLFPTHLQKFPHVLLCFPPSVQFIPDQFSWAQAIHHLMSSSSGIAWRFVSCCRMKPWPSRCIPEDTTPRCEDAVVFLLQGATRFVQITDSGCSKRSPENHTYSSMFDYWCHTTRDHPFTYSTVYRKPVWWSLIMIQSSVDHRWSSRLIFLFRNCRSKTFDLFIETRKNNYVCIRFLGALLHPADDYNIFDGPFLCRKL